MANGRDALVVAFKNAMDMKNMRPEVKVIVEQMAEAYADAYDLHAYSYAARHAEYEFKTGRVEASNIQVLEILEVAKRLATTDERRVGIESLIKRVEDGVSLFTAKENLTKMKSSKHFLTMLSLAKSSLRIFILAVLQSCRVSSIEIMDA